MAVVKAYIHKAPIRIITTGAMQTRFSVSEEVAINSGTDEVAKVLLSRLLNAKNINLDLEELTSGIAYIVNHLDDIGAIYLNESPSVRIDQLLVDGTFDEEYK